MDRICSVFRADTAAIIVGSSVVVLTTLQIKLLRLFERRHKRKLASPCPAGVGRCIISISTFLLLMLSLAEVLLRRPPARSRAAIAASVSLLVAWIATEVTVTVLSLRNVRLANTAYATVLGVVSLCRVVSTFHCFSLQLNSCAAPWLSTFVATGFITLAAIDASVIKTPSDKSSTVPPEFAYRHEVSSIYSRATFFWILPIFRRLRRNRDPHVQPPTVPPLPPSERCEILLARLLKIRRNGGLTNESWTLWRTCRIFCGQPFLLGGLLKMLGDATALVAPVGLAIVVAHAERAAEQSERHRNQDLCLVIPINCSIANHAGITKLHPLTLRHPELQPRTFVVAADSLSTWTRLALGLAKLSSAAPTEVEPYPSLAQLFRNGYVASVAMFISALLQGILSQASTHLVNVQGLRFKAALQALVYRKTLHMPLWSVPDTECERTPITKQPGTETPQATFNRESFSHDDEDNAEKKQPLGATDSQRSCATSALDSGAITNLMDEDTFNIMSFIWIAHYIWAIPLKIAILLVLLHLQLGMCALVAGALCIAIMAPLQLFLGRKMSSDAEVAAEAADERLRRVADALRGARILKLFGWEAIWEKRVGQARNAELMRLDSESTLWAVMTFLTHASSVFVALAAFGLRSLLVDEPLTAPDVFAGLALFNQLTIPLFIFPVTVPLAISAMVSMRRLEGFLDQPELSRLLPPKIKSPLRSQCAAPSFQTIRITGQFSWEGTNTSSPPALCVDNVSIPQGRLTLVVGSVGSGKSSLIAALLGEMRPLIGSGTCRGIVQWPNLSSAAICTQRPWLQSASVRDNILFGLPLRRRAYTRVIVACALQPDLAILPDGDHTQVGDGGVSLSGGQRARVALARAIYAGATGSSAADAVVLLDDPLAPLDPAVAAHVWQRGVLKLLLRRGRGHVAKRSATVIMATHSLALLPDADHIIVVESGRIRAQGTLGEIVTSDFELGQVWRKNIGHLPNFPQLLKIGARKDWNTMPLKAPGTPKGERTARERWQLLRTVSRVGLQSNEGSGRKARLGNPEESWSTSEQRRTSVRRRPAVFHDLPLPVDEYDNAEMSTGGSAGVWRTTGDNESQTEGSQTETAPSSFVHRRLSRASRFARSIRSNLRAKSRRWTASKDVEKGEPNSRKISTATAPFSANASMSSSSISLRTENTKNRRESYLSAVRMEKSQQTYNMSEPLLISYVAYARACGASAVITYFLSTLLWQGFRLRTDWWLSRWADGSKGIDSQEVWLGLRTFALLSAATLLLSLVSSLSGQVSGARARRILHEKAVSGVLRCSAHHLDKQPTGSLMACFCGDVSAIDRKLATSIQRLAQFFLLCCFALLANALLSPWFLLAAFPACVCYFGVQRVYQAASRKLQHLEASTRSASMSLFTDSLRGLATLRAFGQQQRFLDAMTIRMDSHHSAGLLLNATNRWLGVALDGLGAAVVLVSSTGALLAADAGAAAAGVGLAVNYTLLVPVYLTWVVKLAADVELYFGSLHRLRRFCMLPKENAANDKGLQMLESWPDKGLVQFEEVCVQHGDTTEPVIKYLNLSIQAGQRKLSTNSEEHTIIALRRYYMKEFSLSEFHLANYRQVGVCGRTGSGKSSLVMSLFRMVEVRSGRVLIDNVDVSKVPLETLRSRLAVVPQDAVLFSGTVRDNLDPCNRYSDEELWRCLEVTQLDEFVKGLPCALRTTLRDSGEGLSAGTRQLLCVARAALRGARVVVLDEATSALDATAERIFREAAHRAFGSSTTALIVAHRPATLLECERVVVLEGGQIVEDGAPRELLKKPGGALRTLLASVQ